MAHIAINLFLVFCLIIQIYFTIRSVINWRNSKKQMHDFVDKIMKENEKWVDQYNQRQALLAKENARLMEENEKYRDKLKNLGFSDITLDT